MAKHPINRSFHDQLDGYNVTPTFVHFDAPNFRSNSDPICGAAPNLPYKLRQRTVKELEGLEEGTGESLFSKKYSALDYALCVLGVAFFLLVCYYGGVQYGR